MSVLATDAISPRIIHGHVVKDIRKFPFMVYIKVFAKRTKSCSGSIIGKFSVLTAAHCLCPGHMKKIVVETGTARAWKGLGQKYFVKAYNIHPEKPRTCWGTDKVMSVDIAVLKTEKPIQFSDKVKSIDVYTFEIPEYSRALTMGYGYDDQGNYDKLIYASAEAGHCPPMICTFTFFSHLRKGDSGGPLVHCDKGLKKCVQIGVACCTDTLHDVNHYVSTHARSYYIASALKNKGFVNIRGDAARYTPGSFLFSSGLSFFTLILILR